MLLFRTATVSKLTLFAATFVTPAIVSAGYIQFNLVSDLMGVAAATDPNLKNPWGMAASPGSPFWVSDQGTGVSTLYNGAGAPQALIVTIPGNGSTPPQGPTGQVFNSTAASFQLPTGGKAAFLFATLSGTIDAWNGSLGTVAAAKFTATDKASYTGLALGTAGSNDFLYATDFGNAKIDVVNSTFNKVTPSGTFVDPTLPAGYAPYNIQAINGKLYVEYALVNPVTRRASTTPNTGVVSVFDTNGNFLQRLITNTHLDSPWGIALAPAGFAEFGGDLLVGNFGDGTINAFDPVSGAFAGVVSNNAGLPIVNSGLWALSFHGAAPGFDPNNLYITAGINNEADGLFAVITPTPEPATLGSMALVFGGLAFLRRKLISR